MTDRSIAASRVAAAFLFCLASQVVPAQTVRLHDAGRANAAAAGAEAFRGASSSVFETMVANVDAADALDRRLLVQRNELRVSTTVAALPAWTWETFGRAIEDARVPYRSAAENALARIDEKTADLPSLDDNLSEKRRVAREARLARAVGALQGKFATADQFRKAIDRLREAPSSLLEAIDEWPEISAALRTVISNAQASGNARGLQITLLQLGSELAEAEADRAREDLRLAKWEIEHATALVSRVREVESVLDRLAAHASRQPQEETIAATIRLAARRASGEAGSETLLAQHLALLSSYTAVIGYESVYVEEASVLAASERQRSAIRIAQAELEVDAALVRHGLGGLETYYAGGLRPAELANLFRALQTIALAAIAGAGV